MASASIFHQYLQPPKSVMDYSADMDRADSARLGLEGQRQQNKLAQLAFGDRERAIADQAAQRAIYASGATGADLESKLMQGGYAEQAMKFGKDRRENTKTDTETKAKALETSIKAHEFAVQKLGSVADPQQAMAWAQEQLAMGLFTPEQYQAGVQRIQQAAQSPQSFAQWKQMALQGGMSATEQIKAQHQALVQAEVGRHNLSNERNQAGQLAVSQGQLGVAQGNLGTRREELAFNRAQPKGVYDATRGIMVDPRTGQAVDVTMGGQPIGAKAPAAAQKPLPATVVKLQNEAVQALGTFKGLDSDLAQFEKQIDTGKLKFGMVGNVVRSGMNYAGASSEESRNLATFKSKLEGMRNAILLLGKGVQTEGDAVRAYDEIIKNINDQEYVKQRLPELRAKLSRDADLQKNSVDLMRSNYGHDPIDFGKFENQPAATNLPKPGGSASAVDEALKKYGGK